MQAMLVLQIVFLAFAIHSGESIKCYNCASVKEQKCADPFSTTSNEVPMVECTPDIYKSTANAFNSVSQKLNEFAGSLGFGSNNPPSLSTEFVCLKMDVMTGNKLQTTRSCALPKSGDVDFCKSLKDSNKNITFCETCDKDGCNDASSVQVAFMTILVPFIALILAQLH